MTKDFDPNDPDQFFQGEEATRRFDATMRRVLGLPQKEGDAEILADIAKRNGWSDDRR